MTAKSLVYGALTGYASLTALVPSTKIIQRWFDTTLGFPQITLTRASDATAYDGDDKSKKFVTLMQIDVWQHVDNGPPTPVELATKKAIRNTLASHQYGNIRVIEDSYDSTDKVYRLIMQVPIYLDQSEED